MQTHCWLPKHHLLRQLALDVSCARELIASIAVRHHWAATCVLMPIADTLPCLILALRTQLRLPLTLRAERPLIVRNGTA